MKTLIDNIKDIIINYILKDVPYEYIINDTNDIPSITFTILVEGGYKTFTTMQFIADKDLNSYYYYMSDYTHKIYIGMLQNTPELVLEIRALIITHYISHYPTTKEQREIYHY